MDFWLSGEWWMNTLAAAIIAAGAAIASAIITSMVSTRKMNNDLRVHDVKSDHNKSELSAEHRSISQLIGHVDQGVLFLRDERLKEVARQETLHGHTLDLEKIIQVLYSHQQLIANYETELHSLREKLREKDEIIIALKHELQSQSPSEEEDELEI